MTTIKNAINWYLNDWCDGDYFWAFFVLVVGIFMSCAFVALTIETKGGLLLIALAVLAVLGVFYWADENR